MNRRPIVLTISVALGLALTPALAFAHHGGFHGGRVGVGVTTWTDAEDKVPERRSQANRI